MKKFNKFLALGLAGASALTGGFMLAGCGNKDNTTLPAQEEPAESSAVTQQKITIAKSVFADFKSQEDRLALIGTGSSVIKQEGFVDNTFFSYQVDEEDVKEFATISTIYRGEYYSLDNYSTWIDIAGKLFEMDNFQFGTLYKMNVGEETLSIAIKNDANQIKIVASVTDEGTLDKYIFNFNYNSNNKVTNFENLSEGSYIKYTFDLTSTRGLDSVAAIYSSGNNLQIYSERSGKYAEISSVTGNTLTKTMSKITSVNLEISTYDWGTYTQLDEIHPRTRIRRNLYLLRKRERCNASQREHLRC